MTFFEAQSRLLVELRQLIQNGQMTERGMARLTGVSQPHIHNVLKGVRTLSPEIADRVLKTLHLSLLDLGSRDELRRKLLTYRQRLLLVELPLMREPVGSNQPWCNEFCARERLILPVPLLQTGPHLAAVRLQPDPEMEAALGESDLAVVDLSEPVDLDPAGLYVVEWLKRTAVRYVRPSALGVYLASAEVLDSPSAWESVLSAGRSALIRARLIWVGREQDLRLPPHQRGRVLALASS
jgi:transcriptional regulator with XRE-family HTH domain